MDMIEKVQSQLARSIHFIKRMESEYEDRVRLLAEISWLRREDTNKDTNKDPITVERLHAPIASFRKKFRSAFIKEVVINMQAMLDPIVFPMEKTFIIVVVRIYDNLPNPTVSSTLSNIKIRIIIFHTYIQTLNTLFEEMINKTRGKTAVMAVSYCEETSKPSVAAKCFVPHASATKR